MENRKVYSAFVNFILKTHKAECEQIAQTKTLIEIESHAFEELKRKAEYEIALDYVSK